TSVPFRFESIVELLTIAVVQFANFEQNDDPGPPSAASKNGCAVMFMTLFAQVRDVSPQTCVNRFAYALANDCPPSVVMYGTASMLINSYSFLMMRPM